MEQVARQTIIRTYQQPLAWTARSRVSPTIFQRLNTNDNDAVADFIKAYGNEIWEFSIRHTRSPHEAETLSQEIFKDIWSFADRNGNNVSSSENLVVKHIAVRCLIKHKWQAMTRF